MNKLITCLLLALSLTSCSASIGTPPNTSTTTYSTPGVTTYGQPVTRTTVTKTN